MPPICQKNFFFKLLLVVFIFNLNCKLNGQDSIPQTVSYQKQQPTSEEQKRVMAAITAMEAVQKAGAYVESITDLITNQEITLPVGIKKGDYELIIEQLKYNPQSDKTEIYATTAFKFKEDGQVIAFEGMTTLEGKNGIGTQGSLELIAPVYRDMGKQATICFEKGTKAQFACEGIEYFEGEMHFALTSQNIYEVDKTGKPTNKPLLVRFNAHISDFDNYTASFDINKGFAMKELPEVYFTLKGASLDQSDTLTPATVKFPTNYFTNGNTAAEVSLWKGISFNYATIALPKFFKAGNQNDSLKQEGTPERIELGLKNSLFDEYGFTAEVLAKNVIPSETIDPQKWDISLSDLSLLIQKNEITGFGFGGKINLPPLRSRSLFAYSASYNHYSKEYDFFVEVGGQYEFTTLKSTLTLDENSGIEIQIKESELYPTLIANGKLTVNAPINKDDSSKKFSVPDIAFQEMKISREAPNFSVKALGVSGELRSPRFAGFELFVDSITPFNNPKGSGLSFRTGVDLNEMFGGDAGIMLYGDYLKWKFSHVGISSIHVYYESEPFALDGTVTFKNGDKIYGDGFRGDLTLSLAKKRFTLEAVGVFGKTDGYKYFLTDAMFTAKPGMGIPVGPLSFYGLGGGLYKQMQQSNDEKIDASFAESLSGMRYVPDNTVGMGFMASTQFSLTGSPEAFNSMVTFEMQFNRNWGVNFVQLRGEAAFLSMPEGLTDLAGHINKAVEKVNEKTEKVKIATKADLSVPEIKSSGFLTADLNIKYDMAADVFSADLNTYLNAGLIKGIGENDRMGWASAYFSNDKWYTYIGTPADPLGIEILSLAKTQSYFMIGDDIPDLAPVPAKVLKNFSPEKQAKLNTRNNSKLAMGKGMAFGAALDFGFDATLKPFYASINAGLGADFLLKKMPDGTYCSNRGGELGINSWYAKGQAWAYIDADIGMQVTVFKNERRFNILDISAGALLSGSAPNPFYLTGMVGGHFSVLGGMISGQCEFDFEIGEQCIIAGDSPFGEDIIAQLTPSGDEKDVNVFTAPQAIFNIPIGLEMEIEEEDGSTGVYKVTLEEMKVYYKGNTNIIQGKTELSSDGLVCAFNPEEPFESNTELAVKAKVGFMKKEGENWIAVKGGNGQPIYEEKQESFESGERPKTISPQDVKYSYPMPRAYNFYTEEHTAGYIQLTKNYAYLFSTDKPEGFKQVLRITGNDEGKTVSQETDFSYTTHGSENDIRVEINYSFEQITFKNNEIYSLALVNVPENTNTDITSNVSAVINKADSIDISTTTQSAEGTIQKLQEKQIYAHHFRTSKYKTFDEKLAMQDVRGTGSRRPHGLFVHDVVANITEDEYFDSYEMDWINGDLPTVQFVADLPNTNWYKKSFYKNMYANHTGESIAEERNDFDPNFNKLGFPPAMGIEIQNPIGGRTLSDDEISTGLATTTSPNGNFTYAVPFWCSKDHYAIKKEIGIKAAKGIELEKWELEIVANDFPPLVTKGDYPVTVKYVLPGTDIVTSEVEIEMYNPID